MRTWASDECVRIVRKLHFYVTYFYMWLYYRSNCTVMKERKYSKKIKISASEMSAVVKYFTIFFSKNLRPHRLKLYHEQDLNLAREKNVKKYCLSITFFHICISNSNISINRNLYPWITTHALDSWCHLRYDISSFHKEFDVPAVTGCSSRISVPSQGFLFIHHSLETWHLIKRELKLAVLLFWYHHCMHNL